MLAIPLASVTKKPERSGAPKPPAWYGKVLTEHREALGLSRPQFAKESGIDAVKILRNETGMPERSVKGSNEIRDALIALGRDVPPVPVGEHVAEPAAGLTVHEIGRVDADDPKNKTIRTNLRRLRERAGYEVEGLADALRIEADQLLEYERGDKAIPPSLLEAIAAQLGHEISHFWSENPPPSTLGQFDDFWRRRRLHDQLTPEQKAIVREIDEEYTKKLAAALSPEFTAGKKAQLEHIKKAKDRRKR